MKTSLRVTSTNVLLMIAMFAINCDALLFLSASRKLPARLDLSSTTNDQGPKRERLPVWATLPSKQSDDFQDLADAEITVGRIAMLAAVSLLLQEGVTGKSIPEQLLEFAERLTT